MAKAEMTCPQRTRPESNAADQPSETAQREAAAGADEAETRASTSRCAKCCARAMDMLEPTRYKGRSDKLETKMTRSRTGGGDPNSAGPDTENT